MLDRLGLRENTVVIVWSDHGWKLGEQQIWCKMTNDEVDTRVPLIVRAPGMATAGRHSEALVELVDLYPTLCEACAVPVPEGLEGVSMAPLLVEPDRAGKDAVFGVFLREGIWVAPDGIEYFGRARRVRRSPRRTRSSRPRCDRARPWPVPTAGPADGRPSS